MRGFFGTLTAAALITASTLAATAQTTQTTQTAPGTAPGKALYLSHCAVCHQDSGAGGLKLGTAVSADLRSPGLETTYRNSDALIMRAILEGKDEEGGPLDAPMPHWKGQLTEQQAGQILIYLKTLCCSAAPETKSED
ncbi:MAG TPA: cytochrome c [Acetobacteraceae bacterium]|nr:cytochrome c [Acetobacteraceae bacterium]